MQLVIADVLSAADATEIRQTLAHAPFEDGARTAGWNARLVKDNAQARDSATLRLLRERVEAAIRKNELFGLAVRPKALTPLIFSRYAGGQAYGSHVDNPLMDGIRTDVSFTLFLAAPEAYDGGELVIESLSGEDEVKLPAGHMIVYPSTALHRVQPVTRGERLAAVGWAQSHVRDPARRELLFDLETARRRLFDRLGKTQELDLLSKSAANLMRMWAEA
ncbi:MAG TPA: Fe2+-dependent dioxygenase [Beijerinckiaceae bacterium]|jgi:PKHD-type hydroxylase